MGALKISGIRDIQHGTKILFWDIESSSIDIKYRTYDLRVNTQRFDPRDIERDWNILSIAWAINEGPIRCISVSSKDPFNDYELVKHFHGIIGEAELLVGHNSDAFDLKKFNTRAIKYGLPPLPPKRSVDTLKLARKYFKFTSSKLRYIAEFFNISEKDESPDWDKILDGDAQELSYMRSYNKQDVKVTRELYKILAPHHHTHPNMTLVNPVKDVQGLPVLTCKVCGSPDVIRQGYKYTTTKKRPRFSCNTCRHWFS